MLDDAELLAVWDAALVEADNGYSTSSRDHVLFALRAVAARQQLAAFKSTADYLNAEGVDSSSVAALPVQDADLREKVARAMVEAARGAMTDTEWQAAKLEPLTAYWIYADAALAVLHHAQDEGDDR